MATQLQNDSLNDDDGRQYRVDYEPMPSLLAQELVMHELAKAINDMDVTKFCSLFHDESLIVTDFGAGNMINNTPKKLFQVFQKCAEAAENFRVSTQAEKKVGPGTMEYTVKFSWAENQPSISAPLQIAFSMNRRIVMLNMIQLQQKIVTAVLEPPTPPSSKKSLASSLFKRSEEHSGKSTLVAVTNIMKVEDSSTTRASLPDKVPEINHPQCSKTNISELIKKESTKCFSKPPKKRASMVLPRAIHQAKIFVTRNEKKEGNDFTPFKGYFLQKADSAQSSLKVSSASSAITANLLRHPRQAALCVSTTTVQERQADNNSPKLNHSPELEQTGDTDNLSLNAPFLSSGARQQNHQLLELENPSKELLIQIWKRKKQLVIEWKNDTFLKLLNAKTFYSRMHYQYYSDARTTTAGASLSRRPICRENYWEIRRRNLIRIRGLKLRKYNNNNNHMLFKNILLFLYKLAFHSLFLISCFIILSLSQRTRRGGHV